MKFGKNLSSHGNEILFVSIMTLLFAPRDYKLPGLLIFCFFLLTAALIDWEKNAKKVRRITRRVASCSCVKARETISNMYVVPQMMHNCTVCGAEAV